MMFHDDRVILAIDPTSRGLAFACFEAGEILDWGTRRVEGDDLAALDRILVLCPADLLVIEDTAANHCLRRPRVKRVLAAIERHAHARGIELRKVSAYAALRSWMRRGIANKSEMAKAIAEEFPPLETVVPRPRGKYRSEQARMGIFDAAALATYAFGDVASELEARSRWEK
jgi:hypothetical protein